MQSNTIDAREKFRPEGVKYEVEIQVDITMGFIWAVIKCAFKRKTLSIRHTFTNDPLLNHRHDTKGV